MTFTEILNLSRADLNDQNGVVFTDTVLLAYLNMTLMELQELFELNDIPVTSETSSPAITITAGVSEIGFDTIPSLPANLIEIQRVYESDVGQNQWIPLVRRFSLTSLIIANSPRAVFGYWDWESQRVKVLSVTSNRDMKIDYVKSLFNALVIGDLGQEQTVRNADGFIQYRTAGLAAEFITQDYARADKLNGYASMAMSRSLGISTKGKQAIMTRRQPFRAGFKRLRGLVS